MATAEERLSAIESVYGRLATKEDLARLETSLVRLEGKMETLVAQNEAFWAKTEETMAKVRNDVIIPAVLIMIALAGLVFAIARWGTG